MPALVHDHKSEFWRERLLLPAYGIGEAARYALISRQTVANWYRYGSNLRKPLSHKNKGEALSYMQLIEVAVVATFRKQSVSLHRIREAREFIADKLNCQYPFAEYRFKTDGRELFLDYVQIENRRGFGKLLRANQQGQLAWDEIIGSRLREFDYEHDNIVIRWHPRGKDSRIVIDPRLAFGAPSILGTPIWVLRGRWDAGENLEDIAEDFNLKQIDIEKALEFEGVAIDVSRPRIWIQ